MATYSYTCGHAPCVDATVEREFVDTPEMADKKFHERPAILELCRVLKPGDVVRMAYDEQVLSKGLSVLQDWHDRLGVEIEFHLDSDRKTFSGMLQSGLVVRHVLDGIHKSGFLSAAQHETAVAMSKQPAV